MYVAEVEGLKMELKQTKNMMLTVKKGELANFTNQDEEVNRIITNRSNFYYQVIHSWDD